MKLTIIEDCSPYYIRFTFDGIEKIIDFVRNQTITNIKNYGSYTHETYSIDIADQILSLFPMTNMKFNNNRVSIFNTSPGGGCGIHKDGSICRVSFNLSIEILDDKCVTSYYNDELFKDTEITSLPYSRSVVLFKDVDKFDSCIPVKTFVVKPNEMILFNTDIFHSWDNRQSENIRKVLTFRIEASRLGDYYFEDAKRDLFGL